MPASPTITEKNCPDQTGKVFVITGSNTGIGAFLAEILYAHNAKVYMAARTASKAEDTINAIKARNEGSKGSLVFLKLDLGDLTTIKASAEEFLSKESRLDILWNNAGVMIPPAGSKSAQGYELQLGTNCLGPYLFTKFLNPLLAETAKKAEKGSVRVVWLASQAAKLFAPKNGVDMSNLDYHNPVNERTMYGASKAANIFYGSEYAKRFGEAGVVGVSADPGNLKTDLYKHVPKWQMWIANFILKDPIFGAYTELYAGLSADISLANNGAFVEPWGTIAEPRNDVANSLKSKADGGSGIASEFWDWSEKQVTPYL